MRVCFYALCFMVTLLGGCANQSNIALPANFWQQHQAIMLAKVAKTEPGLYQAGPEGLLDYAINVSVNHNFINFIKHADLSWYNTFSNDLGRQLTRRKVAVQMVTPDLSAKETDYFTIASKLKTDNLLIVKLEQLGAWRNYYGFIPLGAPQAYCLLSGQLINRQQHKVIWRYRARVLQAVQGEWDQPPNYPNFAKALAMAMQQARQDLLNDLSLYS